MTITTISGEISVLIDEVDIENIRQRERDIGCHMIEPLCAMMAAFDKESIRKVIRFLDSAAHKLTFLKTTRAPENNKHFIVHFTMDKKPEAADDAAA